MSSRIDVANKIFPDVNESISDLINKFPPRENPICSRFAPSPTWFLHIWWIFASLVEWKFAKQNWGKFLLRIEDTDQKRLVEWWIEAIIDGMKKFGISIDEWPLWINNTDVGDYGPYIQSQRKYFYQVFVKQLISEWKAYPCWMTEEEIEQIRQDQTKSKSVPGIYGNYSHRRNRTADEILARLEETNWDFEVIRFRSHWDLNIKISFDDEIKWKINMIDNYNDIVIIKKDGLPTYHMAHVVDDSLMRVSHVIRWEEWLTSVPLHIQLFNACNLIHPKYCHTAQILKLDDWKKRKLSKRHDPEADVSFFFENWFPIQWIIEYIFGVISSGFEEWQINNPDKDYRDFEIKLDNMNTSGALFDLVKLNSVCNNYLSRISTDQLYQESLDRAKKYKPDLYELMISDEKYTKDAINIERHTEKDPKRFTVFPDIDSQIRFFYDKEREKINSNISKIWEKSEDKEYLWPENITTESVRGFVSEYLDVLDLDCEVQEWFDKLKEIWKKYGFAWNNAEFKEWGYVGKIGDLAMILRIAICGAKQTPDLFSVMKVMGKDRIRYRLMAI